MEREDYARIYDDYVISSMTTMISFKEDKCTIILFPGTMKKTLVLVIVIFKIDKIGARMVVEWKITASYCLNNASYYLRKAWLNKLSRRRFNDSERICSS